MKDEIGKPGMSRGRGPWRRLFHPAGAAAIVAVAGLLAVTPLLAGGIAQLSAGLVAMPDTVQASVAGPDAARVAAPRVNRVTAELATDILSDRLDRVSRIAIEQDGALAQSPAPAFSDPDPLRFAAPTVAEETVLSVDRYAWISDDAVSLASLDQRFATAEPSAARDAVRTPFALAEADAEVQPGIPLPERRPAFSSASVASPAPAESAPTRKPATALAYANPDAEVKEERSGGIFSRLFGRRDEGLLPGRGSKVAVYDIGSATLHMPNGEKLEAHSGLGHMKDNPRYVAEKNKGPTPPNLYNLRMRESLFHGVEAIRLLPADGKKKFNRDGLLAHTYMHVRGGGTDDSQSNGCMAVKDYDKFLKAFKRGEVEHLIVVPHLKEVPTYMAAL